MEWAQVVILLHNTTTNASRPVYEWSQGNEVVFLLDNGNVEVRSAKTMDIIRNIPTELTGKSNVEMSSGINRVYLAVQASGKILEVPLNGTDPVVTHEVGGNLSAVTFHNTIQAATAQTLNFNFRT